MDRASLKQFEAGKKVISMIEQHGFEAYFVGGCVRDCLLQHPIKDIDICTSAMPEQTMSLFEHTIPTGLKHGTVTVGLDQYTFEVTTFRTESAYTDKRRPDQVHFVRSLKQDLQRRDFTINAMAMDQNGKLYDYFLGQEDLKLGRIRTVGDPAARFEEDPLRIMRAIRFSAQLHFEVCQQTMSAMRLKASSLQHIAVERITDELHKLLKAPFVNQGLHYFIEAKLHHLSLFSLLQQALEHMQHLQLTELSPMERWLLLFDLVERPADGEMAQFLKKCTLDKRFKKEIKKTFRSLKQARSVLRSEEWSAWELYRLGYQQARSILKVNQLREHQSVDQQSLNSLQAKYEALPLQPSEPLAVNGQEVSKALQREPGAWLQEALEQATKAVVEEQISNDKSEIITYLKSLNNGG